MLTKDQIEAEALRLKDDIDKHAAEWGSDTAAMPAGQREYRERLNKRTIKLAADFAEWDQARAQREEARANVRALAADPRNIERVGEHYDPEAPKRRTDPWASGLGDNLHRMDSPTGLRQRALDAAELAPGFADHSRALLTRTIETDDDPLASAFILAAADPAYRTAFEKVMPDPVRGHMLWTEREREAFARVILARRALGETGANGGYLVPFTLDPSIILTNAGAANPFRQFCRVETTATVTWNGVSSAGVTAAFYAEGAVVTDNSPTFAQVPITPQKAMAWIPASYEIIGDSNFAAQLPAILSDAKNVLENTKFSTGTGTNEPKGLITAATTTVSTAVVNTFAIADVYALQGALPARSRNGEAPIWFSNISAINKMRQFDTAGGSSYWTNLGQGAPTEVLGLKLGEASGMSGTLTTGNKIAVAGDAKRYQIVDRLGMELIYEPMLKDQATGRPNGSGGWLAVWRVGADALDPASFRTLVVA